MSSRFGRLISRRQPWNRHVRLARSLHLPGLNQTCVASRNTTIALTSSRGSLARGTTQPPEASLR